jgi:hypothetical protein
MQRTLVLLLVACQGKPAPPPPPAAGSDLVSHAEPPPATPVEHKPVPPLPDPLPGKRRDMSAIVTTANRALIADLDGDGHAELALLDPVKLRIVDKDGKEIASAPAAAGIEVLTVYGTELVAGFGASREHRDATAQFTGYRLEKTKITVEAILVPTTTRQDVVAAIPDGPRLVLAYFESKYGVTKVSATRAPGAWTTSEPQTIRMATSWGLGDLDGSGKPSIVVGRLYGDVIGADGDAFVLAADGTHKMLPTTRGVQSLAVADTDGDGRAEIFVGDGWHQNYALNAQGLLTWIRLVDGAFKAELIEDTPGQYTINQIIAADVDGDGKPELVTRGNAYVRVYKRSGDRWIGLTIAGKVRDVAVGDLDGNGTAILVVGDRSELVDLHGATWQ